jgi:Holliday junction resolvase
MATTPENRIKRQIKDWLKEEGIFHWSNAAGPYSVHGIPDIMAVRNGIVLGIEVKAPGKLKTATPHQKRFIAQLRAAGAIARVVDTLSQVQEMIADADITRQEYDRA